MDTTDRIGPVARALVEARPDSIHLVARDHLLLDFGALDSELFLADYRQATLCRTVHPTLPAVRVDGDAAGQAFLTEDVVITGQSGGVRVCAPVAVRGACLGVLSAVWPERPDLLLQQDFRTLATVLAHALVVAEQATDHYRRVRTRRPMTLAAEIQWNLLPGRGLGGDRFQLAGQLEPAYAIRGDTFDWSADEDHLNLTVCNGMGEGVASAMLTSLAVNALRNGRRAELSLTEQAVLANEMVWSQYAGRSYVSTVLVRVELATGLVHLVDAGSPHLFRLRGGEHQRLEFMPELSLGMFDGSQYQEQVFQLERGDRLLLLSDGVVDATLEGRSYGGNALDRAIRAGRLLSPAGAVRLLLSDLMTFHGSQDLADDAVAVCLNWSGKDDG